MSQADCYFALVRVHNKSPDASLRHGSRLSSFSFFGVLQIINNKKKMFARAD